MKSIYVLKRSYSSLSSLPIVSSHFNRSDLNSTFLRGVQALKYTLLTPTQVNNIHILFNTHTHPHTSGHHPILNCRNAESRKYI